MDKFGVGILYDYMVLLFVLEHPFVQMMHLRMGISAVLLCCPRSTHYTNNEGEINIMDVQWEIPETMEGVMHSWACRRRER